MDEAELCRKLMFMYYGQSLFYDSIEKITESYPYTVFESEVAQTGSADKLEDFYCLSREQINDAYKIITDDAERTRKEMLKKFPQAELKEIKPALEDVFIWLMEKGEADG